MSIIKAIDGLPVIDAKRSVAVRITTNDIQRADPKRPETCAAARAICRDLHAYEARVHLGRVYVRSNKGNWLRYETPRPLRSEIIAFDRGGKFEPGEYTLQALPPSKRTGKGYGGVKKKSKAAKPKIQRRKSPHLVTNVRNGPA